MIAGIKDEIYAYRDAVFNLAYRFIQKYYSEEIEWVTGKYNWIDGMYNFDILWGDWNAPWTLSVCDDYYSIEDVWVALYHDIPKEILMKWYSESLDYHMSEKTDDSYFPNLVNYYKGCPVYTEEKQKADEKKIAEIYDMLEQSIVEHKTKESKKKV